MDPTQSASQPKSRDSKSVRVIGGVVLMVALLAIGIVPKLTHQKALADETKSETSAIPEVETVVAKLAPADPIVLPASVQAVSSTIIQARTSGYVKSLLVDIGTKVKAGQLLAEIESPDADQQLAQANADTAKSIATVGQSEADRAKGQAGVTQTQADVARQRAAIKQAEAAWAGAKARLAQAVAAKDQTESKAAQSQQQIETQKANLAQTQAQFELAEATVKRYESLLKEGFVSQQDYDQSAAAYKSASSTVKAAKANVKAAESDAKASRQAVTASESAIRAATSDAEASKANIEASKATFASVSATVSAAKATVRANDQTINANRAAVQSSAANARRYDVLKSFQRIVAPFDGVITSRNVDLGSLVSPGSLVTVAKGTTTPTGGLFGIARVDTLKILINVPQTDFRAINADTVAKITIREFPGQTFSGKIARSSGALDASSRTLPVEIHLDNKDQKILHCRYRPESHTSVACRCHLVWSRGQFRLCCRRPKRHSPQEGYSRSGLWHRTRSHRSWP
jgi:multidrug efflux pump subunit AcrA (membrane-fusion protein)